MPRRQPAVCGDGLVELAGQPAFAGVRGQPFADGRAAFAVRQRRAVLRRGLRMRAALQRLARGLGRERRDGARVTGAHGVMHAARERHRGEAVAVERAQHVGVQGAGDRRRQRVLDRDARQLVAEEERAVGGVEQPRVQAFVQRRGGRRQQRVDQRALDARGHRRREPHDGLRRGRQPREARQHQVLHAARHAVGAVAQQLADEQRIAVRQRVQPGGRAHRRLRQRGDGVGRQRRQRQPRHLAGGQLAEQPAQRMRGRHLVVAPRHHEQARHAVDAAAQELQQVQRGVVGPVQVLEDGQHRAAAALQRRQHRVEQLGARVARLQQRAERDVDVARDVVQRRERVRRLERVAGAPPQRRVAAARGHRLEQRRFADAGLAADQHQVAAAVARRGELAFERQQGGVALDELHGVMPAAGGPAPPSRRRVRPARRPGRSRRPARRRTRRGCADRAPPARRSRGGMPTAGG